MKKFLLFWFTAAFLLASVNTFAQQQGKTVKVTNDKELFAAMDNQSVSTITLAEGYYSYLDMDAPDGTTMFKGANKGGTCSYIFTPANVCFNGDPTSSVATVATASVGGGICPTINSGVWSLDAYSGPAPVGMAAVTWSQTPIPSDYTQPFTVNYPGRYTLRYTWSPTESGTFDYFFYTKPTVTLTGPASDCGTDLDLAWTYNPGSYPQPGTYSISWAVDGGTAPGTITVTSATSGSFNHDFTTCGPHTITATVNSSAIPNICTMPSASVNTYLYDVPTVDAGANKTTCGLSVTLTPGTPTASCYNGGSIGTAWSKVSGPGTPSFAGNVATVDVCGTYVYRYTTTNGVCTNTDDVEVKYYDTPAGGNAGVDKEFCGLSGALTPTNYTVSCTNGGTLGHAWTKVGGPTGTVTFTTNNVEVSVCGTYTFRYTATNGDCSAYDEVTVKFFDTPVADAGKDAEVCGLTITLDPKFTANCDNGATATEGWTKTSGPGTVTFVGNVATVSECGQYVFEYKVDNGPCSDVDDVMVKFFSTPTGITAGTNKNECGLTTPLTPDYTIACGTLGTPVIGWTMTAGPGLATFTGSDKTWSVTVSVCGEYTFEYSVDNGPCDPVTAAVTIKFYDTPTGTSAGTDADVCGLAKTLSPTLGTVSCDHGTAPTGAWSLFSGAGTASITGNNVTVSVCGSYTFRYTTTNGPCSQTDDVVIRFFDTPVGTSAGSDAEVCGLGASLTPVQGTVSCDFGETRVNTWSFVSGPGLATFVANSVTVSVCGDYVFQYKSENGPCEATDNVSVRFHSTPTIAFDAEPANVCGYTASFYYSFAADCFSGTYNGNWTYTGPVGGTATLNTLVPGTLGITVDKCGSYDFTYTVGNGTCTATKNAVIRFYETPKPQITGELNVYTCSTVTYTVVDGRTCDFGGLKHLWTVSGGTISGSATGTSVTVDWNNITGPGTITVTSELDDNAGCVGTTSATATKIAPTFAGQVKYWNAFETYMPTPFPTDFYGTFPEDYFYVTLCKMVGASVVEIETKLVEPRLMEDLAELMSSFEFTLPVASDGCDVDYLLKIWDGGLTYHSLFGGPTPPPVSGTYLGESYTYTNWGGGNATDALALQLMVGNATNINGAPYNYAWVGTNIAAPTPYGYYSKSIGDVNLSGAITALDALTLNYRAVGLIGSFPNSIPGKQYSPNFKVTGRMVTALPQMTFPAPFYTTNVNDVPFTHSGTSYLYFTPATDHKYTSSVIPWDGKKNYMNIYYTATGDINSSYVPTSAGFKAEPAMSLILEGEQAVNAGDVVTIPVRVDRNSELGAITLGLSYRNDLVEVIGTNYGADFAKIDTEKSLINIGWFSTDGINVSENEAIAYITVRVLANIEKGTSLFTLQANTEFADRSANVIEGVNLKSTAVYTGKTGSELNATNYPNPFSNTTTISYNLPEAGNVQIAIFNKLGQSVRTLVDGMQSAGAHTFELANANLQPGVYQYRITLTGKNGSYSVVKSMIVVE